MGEKSLYWLYLIIGVVAFIYGFWKGDARD